MTESHTYDVVVIGGGPAGSSAATHLARHGHDVLLVEKDRLPRHVVCGEFLSPEARDALQALGAMDAVNEAGAVSVDFVSLTGASGEEVHGQLPGVGLALSRFRLDRILLDNAESAGVLLREGTPANDVSGDLVRGFSVELPDGVVRARAVIGAFGKRSALDRTLDRSFFGRRTPYVGLKQHFDSASCGTAVELHGFDGGYCGIVQVEGGRMNACSLIRADVLREIGPKEPFAGMARLNPRLAERLGGRRPLFDRPVAISQISFETKDVMEADVCMVGDAARLITPLCGDGMAMALHAGRHASDWASRFLGGDIDADAFRSGYRRTWAEEFAPRTRIGRVLQRGYLNASLARIGLRVMSLVPPVTRWAIRATRG